MTDCPSDRITTRTVENNVSIFGKLAVSEHEWLTEVKHCDILVKFNLLVVLGVLRLTADRVPHLPVFLGDVVVPGPHCDVLGGVILSAVSGSENLLPGKDGTTTNLVRASHRQSDLPRIFIFLNLHSANNIRFSVGSSALALGLSPHQTDGQRVPGGGV